jgi:hypothetical protein
MWIKKNILSKISWKKLKSVHHLLLVVLCAYVFYKFCDFYLEFLISTFQKNQWFNFFAFVVPLIFIASYDGYKNWKLSPSAFKVLKIIHLIIRFIGVFFLVVALYAVFKDKID